MHNHEPRDKHTDVFTVRFAVRGRVRGQQERAPFFNISRKNRHLAAPSVPPRCCDDPNSRCRPDGWRACEVDRAVPQIGNPRLAEMRVVGAKRG